MMPENARSLPEVDLADVAGATVTRHRPVHCRSCGFQWANLPADVCARCAGTDIAPVSWCGHHEDWCEVDE